MDSSLNQKLNSKEDEEVKNSAEDQRLLKFMGESEAVRFVKKIKEKAEDLENLKRKLVLIKRETTWSSKLKKNLIH